MILNASRATRKGITLLSGLLLGLVTGGHAQPAGRAVDAITGNPAGGATPVAAPEVLNYADVRPGFTGGDAALHQYLARKINYPANANQRNLSGTVYVRFVVDEQGRARDAEVAKGCGNGFELARRYLLSVRANDTASDIQG